MFFQSIFCALADNISRGYGLFETMILPNKKKLKKILEYF